MAEEDILMLALAIDDEWNRKRRAYWVHPTNQKRQSLGEYHRLVSEFGLLEDARYRNYMRMTRLQFAKLLEQVGPEIWKLSTRYRQPIEPAERLAVTIRYCNPGLRDTL